MCLLDMIPRQEPRTEMMSGGRTGCGTLSDEGGSLGEATISDEGGLPIDASMPSSFDTASVTYPGSEPGCTVQTPYPCDLLYVSTNMEFIEADDIRCGYEVMIGNCFRLLDANYYAWLRDGMNGVKKTYEAGQTSEVTYNAIRSRFNVIHEWAVQHIGHKQLLDATNNMKPGRYLPPSKGSLKASRMREHMSCAPSENENAVQLELPMQSGPEYLFPKTSTLLCTAHVTQQAYAQVNAIRSRALSLGWTEASLFQNRGQFRFPHSQDYGLVCFLSCGGVKRTIGEVSAQVIQIVEKQQDRCHCFYNMNVPQPWNSRITE
ncbi:MAG: hypothetical protein ACYC1M_18930 [Armatimonadota bacterium]